MLWIKMSHGICIKPDDVCPSPYVTFYLTNSNGLKIFVDDTEDSVIAADFVEAPLKVLIHGTGGSKDATPNSELIPEYMVVDEYNILSVDYNELVPVNCFAVRMTVTEPVGRCLARMLDLIFEHVTAIKPADTHMIGFSLGAHIAGIAANILKPSHFIGRITGLDPGGVGYQGVTGPKVAAELRLDSSHASFVDVIHTDSLFLGLYIPLGHVDFYVNKGYAQPNCVDINPFQLTSLITEVGATITCSHMRSAEYYAATINSPGKFYGQRCSLNPLLKLWIGDVCSPTGSSEIAEMGEHTPPKTRKSYKVITNDSPPWAKLLDIFQKAMI